MMTHTEDDTYDREQLPRFRALARTWQRRGFRRVSCTPRRPYALFQHPDAFLDMVRPGMGLYGIYPEPKVREAGLMDLLPAIALKARVAYVKLLQRGDTAGYNRAYVAERPVWVATLPVGHADGLPRAAASGGRVRIGGALYPIIASISASHAIVEIGAETALFDWTDGSRPEDLSLACGASVYDLTMHLNPLLPRRVVGA